MKTTVIQKIPARRDLAFRTVQDMRDFARAHTPDAIKTLIEIHQDPHMKAAARVSAAREILDRAWGRPQQQVIVEQPDEQKIINLVSDAEYTVNKVMNLSFSEVKDDGDDSKE